MLYIVNKIGIDAMPSLLQTSEYDLRTVYVSELMSVYNVLMLCKHWCLGRLCKTSITRCKRNIHVDYLKQEYETADGSTQMTNKHSSHLPVLQDGHIPSL